MNVAYQMQFANPAIRANFRFESAQDQAEIFAPFSPSHLGVTANF